jgi:diguanylate cyclase (GGDEF)-like protein
MFVADRTLPKQMNLTKRLENLCRKTVLSLYICILINFFVSIGVWEWIVRPAQLSYTTAFYWARFIIVPNLLLLTVVGLVNLLIQRPGVSLEVKQYSVVLLLVVFLAFLTVVHKVAMVLLGSFAIPVFVSSVFSKPKLTKNIFHICIGVVLLCAFFIYPDIPGRYESAYLSVEVVTALALLGGSYLFSRTLIRYSSENLSELQASYETQSRMHSILRSDRFTGLNNRSTFDEYLARVLEESTQTKETVTLALFDLDNFKTVNDSFGHAKGDEVLLYFSQLLKGRESQDVDAFRFGGDEFALLFKHREPSEIFENCENLRREFAQNSSRDLGIPLTLSCGIASFTPGLQGPAVFFDLADQTLYLAKQRGRNQTAFA